MSLVKALSVFAKCVCLTICVSMHFAVCAQILDSHRAGVQRESVERGGGVGVTKGGVAGESALTSPCLFAGVARPSTDPMAHVVRDKQFTIRFTLETQIRKITDPVYGVIYFNK